jgi:hypothetical protein
MTVYFNMFKRLNTDMNMFCTIIQPTISLEMPVPSQGHYGFPSFPVVDWLCLFIYFLTFPLENCPEFGHFVITLIISNDKQMHKRGERTKVTVVNTQLIILKN